MAGNDALMLPFTRAMDRFAGALELIGHGMKGFNTANGPNPKDLPKGGTADIAKSLATLSAAFGKLSPAIGTALASFLKLVPVIGAATVTFGLAKKTPIIGNLMGTGAKAYGMVFDKFTAGLKAAYLPIEKFANKIDMMGSVAEVAGKASQAFAESVSNSAKFIGESAKGLMKSFGDALTNPLEALPALANKIRPFVEAFNPFVVEQFDDALRSVYAIIGEALVPVMKMASEVVRNFAGYLRPMMKQLEPIFADMARFMGDFLKDMTPILATLIPDIVSAFQRLLEELKKNADAWPETTKASIKYALGVGSWMSTWVAWIKDLFRKIPLIGGLFGKSGPGMLKVNAEKENISSFGAASNPTYRAAESLGRDTLQAAYAAMPGLEDKKKERDLLEDIAANTDKANGILNQIFKVQSGAETYDARVQGGLGPNASMVDRVKGAAQWWVGQGAEKVYNFGNGVGNLWNGKSWSEGAIDI